MRHLPDASVARPLARRMARRPALLRGTLTSWSPEIFVMLCAYLRADGRRRSPRRSETGPVRRARSRHNRHARRNRTCFSLAAPSPCARSETGSIWRMHLGEVELYNPDVYVNGVPHDAFRLLRQRGAGSFPEGAEGGAAIGRITKYDDIVTISKDPKTLLLAPRHQHRGLLAGGPGRGADAHGQHGPAAAQQVPASWPASAFTPRWSRKLEPRIRELTDEILDDVAEKGDVRLRRPRSPPSSRSRSSPSCSACRDDERHQRLRLVQPPHRLRRPRVPDLAARTARRRRRGVDVREPARRQRARASTGDDLVTRPRQRRGRRRRGSREMEFDAFFLLLAVAGNETTRNLISGGMLALLEHPEQRARLLADPSLVPSAVEEMLRWVTPVMYFRRTATRDVEIRGQKIREGEKVVMYYPSRQPRRGRLRRRRPFDVGRTPERAPRLRRRGSTSAWAPASRASRSASCSRSSCGACPTSSSPARCSRLRSNFINGYKEMPVRFTPAEALSEPTGGGARRVRALMSAYPRGWFVVASPTISRSGQTRRSATSARSSSPTAARTARCASSTRTARTWARTSARAARSSATPSDCPFHAWRLRRDRRVRRDPLRQEDPAKARQRAWPVREINGVVLVHHDPGGASPTSRSRSSPSTAASEWLPWTTSMYHVKTHPREIVDNLADRAHSPRVHRPRSTTSPSRSRATPPRSASRGARICPAAASTISRRRRRTTGPAYLLMRMSGMLRELHARRPHADRATASSICASG